MHTSSNPAIGDLDGLFSGISIDAPVICAVSGGSDSIALLLLAHRWALKNRAELHCVSIDHGLRAEAASEAAFVAGVCANLGLPHSTLAWDGMKPNFGLQEAARLSRYALLDDFAHELGAATILTGHTRDDQAETVFMRATRTGGAVAELSDKGRQKPVSRKSHLAHELLLKTADGSKSPDLGIHNGGRGLSGMARQTVLFGGTRIVRPLLKFSRGELREFLIANGQSWVEDPSNLDATFERVRVRRMLEKNPVLREKLLALADVAGRFRRILAQDAARLLTEHAKMQPGPVFSLDVVRSRDGHLNVVSPVGALALQALIAVSGGREHFVAHKKLMPVLEAVHAAADSGVSTSMTLGGSQIEVQPVREKAQQREAVARVVLIRETRNLSALMLEPGEAAIWDGRLSLYNGTDLPVLVEAAGRSQIAELELNRGRRYDVKPRKALLSSPLLHVQHGSSKAVPVLPLVENGNLPRGLEARIASVAIEHFCPQYDFALKGWLRLLDSHAAASLQP